MESDGNFTNTNDHVVLFMESNNLNNSSNNTSSSTTTNHAATLDNSNNNESSSTNHNSKKSDQQQQQQHPQKPPLPNARTLRRLSFSKPKARTVEFNLPILHQSRSSVAAVNEYPRSQLSPVDEREMMMMMNTHDGGDNNNNCRQQEVMEDIDMYSSIWNTSDSDDSGFDEDDSEKKGNSIKKKKKSRMWKAVMEWVMFLIILGSLICSLTIQTLRNQLTWGLELWKWCLMVMVIFSGRLVSGWVMAFVVFLIERNFMLKEKVLYFVYGLRRSFQNCFWLGLVLMAWTFMFNPKVHKQDKMLHNVFRALVAVLIGATIWLLKIVAVKVLASSFHVRTYFDRMKESVFHHYILETLSGPPLDEIIREEEHKRFKSVKSLPTNWKEARFSASKSKRFGSRKIDMDKLKMLSMQRRASAWSMKRLMNYIRFSGLSTISQTVDKFGSAEEEITSEWEARNTAKRIFRNVAKTNAKFIEEEDLARFLTRAEIHTIFPLFEGALETGRITKSAFRNWVVRAYFERKSLAHSLNDTKTAVQQLHKLASGIVSVIIIVVTLLVMGWATPNIIAVVMTQLVLLGFMFQNMCKTVFESIIFVFVMHPFDIGDRCVVEGVQMVVEEMNILTTVFLRYDMEKIYYPNSVLLTKPISNFYRSPEMCDAIEFFINASTSVETITAFKKAIQSYIDSKPKHWNPKHGVLVKEIQDLNKMKMLLCVQHTINHQNYGERSVRISELILEMKRIFESLGIKYQLLPQEVHLTQFSVNNSSSNHSINGSSTLPLPSQL